MKEREMAKTRGRERERAELGTTRLGLGFSSLEEDPKLLPVDIQLSLYSRKAQRIAFSLLRFELEPHKRETRHDFPAALVRSFNQLEHLLPTAFCHVFPFLFDTSRGPTRTQFLRSRRSKGRGRRRRADEESQKEKESAAASLSPF